MAFSRKVGTSYEYVDKRLASSNAFHVNKISNDGRYGRIVIEHNVRNSYCTPAAGITYANQQDLYQDGSHWVYGAHDKMPNHQQHRQNVYSDGTNKVELIFNHKLKDPNCLWALRPDCGSEQYQYVK